MLQLPNDQMQIPQFVASRVENPKSRIVKNYVPIGPTRLGKTTADRGANAFGNGLSWRFTVPNERLVISDMTITLPVRIHPKCFNYEFTDYQDMLTLGSGVDNEPLYNPNIVQSDLPQLAISHVTLMIDGKNFTFDYKQYGDLCKTIWSNAEDNFTNKGSCLPCDTFNKRTSYKYVNSGFSERARRWQEKMHQAQASAEITLKIPLDVGPLQSLWVPVFQKNYGIPHVKECALSIFWRQDLVEVDQSVLAPVAGVNRVQAIGSVSRYFLDKNTTANSMHADVPIHGVVQNQSPGYVSRCDVSYIAEPVLSVQFIEVPNLLPSYRLNERKFENYQSSTKTLLTDIGARDFTDAADKIADRNSFKIMGIRMQETPYLCCIWGEIEESERGHLFGIHNPKLDISELQIQVNNKIVQTYQKTPTKILYDIFRRHSTSGLLYDEWKNHNQVIIVSPEELSSEWFQESTATISSLNVFCKLSHTARTAGLISQTRESPALLSGYFTLSATQNVEVGGVTGAVGQPLPLPFVNNAGHNAESENFVVGDYVAIQNAGANTVEVARISALAAGAPGTVTLGVRGVYNVAAVHAQNRTCRKFIPTLDYRAVGPKCVLKCVLIYKNYNTILYNADLLPSEESNRVYDAPMPSAFDRIGPIGQTVPP